MKLASMVGKTKQFLSYVVPGVIKPLRVLWNEMIGFIEAEGLQDLNISRAGEEWGIRMPFSGGSLGMRALQSVVVGAGTTTTGGDFVYAPTAIPAGGACIEMTTAYTPSGPA